MLTTFKESFEATSLTHKMVAINGNPRVKDDSFKRRKLLKRFKVLFQ